MSFISDAAWTVRRLMNRAGIDVVPFRIARHPIARRRHLFNQNEIDLVVDVGANCGQYGSFLRQVGYTGRICSYEPLSSAYAALSAAAASDPQWDVHHIGLGETEGNATLNIAQNSESSSILPMLPAHLRSYPESRYVATETVPMTTLAEVLGGFPTPSRIFVKVDTQGYERQVIEGAGDAIANVRGVQLEMSRVSLYDGESLMPEMINFMKDKGLILMSIEPGSSDPQTGQLLQLDGLFFRPSSP